MSDLLAVLLVGGLGLAGTALVLLALRPRPAELHLPREDEIDLGDEIEPQEAPPILDLTAREIERDRGGG